MTKLDRIIQEGFNRIDEAVLRVIDKYDHMLWCNGLNDDAPILQRLLDRDGRVLLGEDVHAVYSAIEMRDGDRIEGSGSTKTAIFNRITTH